MGGTVHLDVTEPYNQSVFAELVERARRNRGLTQDELGAVAGVGQQAVGKWENGITRPRPDAFPALARALGVASELLLVEAGYLDGNKPDPLEVDQELADGSTVRLTIRRGAAPSLFEDYRPRAEAAPMDDDRLTSLEERVARLEALLEGVLSPPDPPPPER